MKKASKQLIALIYETSKNYKALDEEAHQKAVRTYEDDEYNAKIFDYFKEDIKGWKFVRYAQIKGVDWNEVWEHFKNPDVAGTRETFMAEWTEYCKKQRAKDDKVNKPFIDLIQEDMTKLIRMIAHIDDANLDEIDNLGGSDLFSYKEGFKEKMIGDKNSYSETRYSKIIKENNIKSVRWDSLYDYFNEQLEEAKKNATPINVQDVKFYLIGYEGTTAEEKIKYIKERGGIVITDDEERKKADPMTGCIYSMRGMDQFEDIKEFEGVTFWVDTKPSPLEQETTAIESKGGIVVDNVEDAHIVLGWSLPEEIKKKAWDKEILSYNHFNRLLEDRYPNATNKKIADIKTALETKKAGANFSI